MKRLTRFIDKYQATKLLVNDTTKVLNRRQQEEARICFADAAKIKILMTAFVPILGFNPPVIF
jgi:hypothetical protein